MTACLPIVLLISCWYKSIRSDTWLTTHIGHAFHATNNDAGKACGTASCSQNNEHSSVSYGRSESRFDINGDGGSVNQIRPNGCGSGWKKSLQRPSPAPCKATEGLLYLMYLPCFATAAGRSWTSSFDRLAIWCLISNRTSGPGRERPRFGFWQSLHQVSFSREVAGRRQVGSEAFLLGGVGCLGHR